MNNETCGCGAEEETSSAKGIAKINYKEDFGLAVELLAGDKPCQLGDENLRISFMVMTSRYTVGRTAGVCERCSIDGNRIRCFMDAHGLPLGELRTEVEMNMPDPNYADGKRLSMVIAGGTALLVKGNTHFDGAAVKAETHVMMIDTHDLTREHGYESTIDEYCFTFTGASHLKENTKGALNEMTRAEKLQTNAETGRTEAETQRQDAEKLREQAEAERGNSEKKRMSLEEERSTVFPSMQGNIGSRIKEVNTAASDLKSIIGVDKGVFLGIDSLKAAYSSPQAGLSAKVRTELLYAIYTCKVSEAWRGSGTTYAPTAQVPAVR